MRARTGAYSRCKSGARADLGEIFFRSAWEANYARYLNLLKTKGVVLEWEYEPETFWFEKIKRGVRSYKPDFRVRYAGGDGPVYEELKGYLDARSKTKLARMGRYHPNVKLRLINAKEYRAIEKEFRSEIPNWE